MKKSFNGVLGNIKKCWSLYVNRTNAITKERENLDIVDKQRTVFVIHGRNTKIKDEVFLFLHSLDIKPLEWECAVKMTKKGTPTTLEVIKTAMKNSQGVIVLFTGDDIVKTKEEFCELYEVSSYKSQPRPNVFIEAGMAMALQPNSTIFIHFDEKNQRSISDIDGINYIKLSNQAEDRQALVSRLKTIGVKLDDNGSNWLKVGNFKI